MPAYARPAASPAARGVCGGAAAGRGGGHRRRGHHAPQRQRASAVARGFCGAMSAACARPRAGCIRRHGPPRGRHGPQDGQRVHAARDHAVSTRALSRQADAGGRASRCVQLREASAARVDALRRCWWSWTCRLGNVAGSQAAYARARSRVTRARSRERPACLGLLCSSGLLLTPPRPRSPWQRVAGARGATSQRPRLRQF